MATAAREDMEVEDAGCSSSSSTTVQAQTLRPGIKAQVRTGLHVALANSLSPLARQRSASL